MQSFYKEKSIFSKMFEFGKEVFSEYLQKQNNILFLKHLKYLEDIKSSLILERDILNKECIEAKINESYKNIGVNIPISYVNASNEEVLEYYSENIEIFKKNGKQALVKRLEMQVIEEAERPEKLEKFYVSIRKGKDYYTNFLMKKNLYYEMTDLEFDKNIEKIKKGENVAENIQKLVLIFKRNTGKVDKIMSAYNELMDNFFKKAAIDIKSIYNIKTDGVNKYLEKIPKVGMIFTSLRVQEQILAIKALLEDYKDITDSHVVRDTNPKLEKYFVQQQQLRLILDEAFNQVSNEKDVSILLKIAKYIEDNGKTRGVVYKNLSEKFVKGGMNIHQLTKKAKRKAILDLSIKVLATFGSLFQCYIATNCNNFVKYTPQALLKML